MKKTELPSGSSPAMALASRFYPVPGGPMRRSPWVFFRADIGKLFRLLEKIDYFS